MDTICSIEPCPTARALVTVVDHGERADFYTQTMDTEFDMPWALTAAVEIAAANGLGFQQRGGWLGIRVDLNFDTGELLVDHDQQLF